MRRVIALLAALLLLPLALGGCVSMSPEEECRRSGGVWLEGGLCEYQRP